MQKLCLAQFFNVLCDAKRCSEFRQVEDSVEVAPLSASHVRQARKSEVFGALSVIWEGAWFL